VLERRRRACRRAGWARGDAASSTAEQPRGASSGAALPDAGRACWTCAAPPPHRGRTGEPARFSPRCDADGMRAPLGGEGASARTRAGPAPLGGR
jgi:hypothetical protein